MVFVNNLYKKRGGLQWTVGGGSLRADGKHLPLAAANAQTTAYHIYSLMSNV